MNLSLSQLLTKFSLLIVVSDFVVVKMDNSEIVKMRLEWMLCPDTLSPLHRKGVDEFLAFAFFDLTDEDQLPCPCRNCHFSEHKTRKDMESDLLGYGMVKSYVRWIYHGEYTTTHKRARNEIEIHGFDDMIGMIHDAFGDHNVDAPIDEEVDQYDEMDDHASCGNESESSNLTLEQFENLLKNAQRELCPGYQNFSRLSFTVKLF